jgi:TonB family protein
VSDRIVDVVFAKSATAKRPSTTLLALLIALVIHLSVVLWATRAEKSLESWSADMALIVHDELQDEDTVTLEDEKPKEEKTPTPTPTPVASAAAALTPVADATPAAPAAAAQVMTAEGDPVDLSDDTFVSGTAALPSGGITASSGVQTNKATQALAPLVEAPDLSTKVTLVGDDWKCAWPSSAEGEVINEQDVIIRVDVDASGKVVNASLVKDAKGGFGEAALACASRTRFVPAKDKNGKPVRALSPPIEVHFSR